MSVTLSYVRYLRYVTVEISSKVYQNTLRFFDVIRVLYTQH